jgi:hypothetical protein
MTKITRKKAKKKIQKTKKAFQKIIDILDGKPASPPPSIIYWAEESEVLKEPRPKQTGS